MPKLDNNDDDSIQITNASELGYIQYERYARQ